MPAAKPCLGYPSRTAAAVALRAEGQSNAEIAAAIGISTSTAGALSVGKSRPGQRRKLTPQQVHRVCEMRESGMSFGRISLRMKAHGVDIHPNSISWLCLVHGADLPPEKRQATNLPVPGSVCHRGGHQVRRFSIEEDAELRRLDGEGLSYMQIAKAMGRKRNSIIGRLATLARRDARAEEAQAA